MRHSIPVLIIFVFFSPVFFAADSTIPANFPDAWEFIWTIWWDRQVVFSQGSLFYTPALFHPNGSSLLLHATVEGITLVPAVLFASLSPFRVFSICCALAWVANYLAARTLFVTVGLQSRRASIWALLFAFHPYFLAHLAGGQLSFLCFFPVVLALNAALPILGYTPRRRYASFWLAVPITALAFINLYYLYFTVISLCVLALLSWGRTSVRGIINVAAAIAIAVTAAAWKLVPLARLSASGLYSPNHDPRQHSLDVLSVFVPSGYQLVGASFAPLLEAIRVNTAEAGGYIGWTVLLAVIVTFWRNSPGDPISRRLRTATLLCASLFLLLSWGPQLQVAGHAVCALPAFPLLSNVLFAFPSVPARFSIVTELFLFLYLAFPLKHFSTRSCFAVVCLLCLEYFPSRLPMMQIHANSPAIRTMRECENIRAIHDTGAIPQSAMMRQTIHEKPITGGFLSRRPKRAEHRLRNNRFVRYLEDGRESSEQEIAAGFEALGVDTLLVERVQPGLLSRADNLPWLMRFAEDAEVVVYRRKDAPRCG